MSVSLIKQGETYFCSFTNSGGAKKEHCEFIVDDENDVTSLPKLEKCMAGSIAYTPDIGYIWMLGQDDEWHEI